MIDLLAQKQLTAYNQSCLESFCGCYHPQVKVYDQEQVLLYQGLAEFRKRYLSLFTHFDFGATVDQRLVLGRHCIDLESWWRTDLRTQEQTQGQVLVRYSMKDDLIECVQFLMPKE